MDTPLLLELTLGVMHRPGEQRCLYASVRSPRDWTGRGMWSSSDIIPDRLYLKPSAHIKRVLNRMHVRATSRAVLAYLEAGDTDVE